MMCLKGSKHNLGKQINNRVMMDGVSSTVLNKIQFRFLMDISSKLATINDTFSGESKFFMELLEKLVSLFP